MSPDAGLPLVPLLRSGEDATDAETLEMWYLALSNVVSVELPHDLLGVWLYPTRGGVELIAPAALAADQLTVPVPPDITRPQLDSLEEIIRDAGYPSVMAVVIRTESGAVGLLLFAALQPGIYGEHDRAIAQSVADALVPMFTPMARRWGLPPEPAGGAVDREAAALAAVARSVASAGTSREIASGIRSALAPFVPADRVELLVPGTSAEQWYRLGEHPGGPLWSDPDLVLSRAELDVPALFGTGETVLRDDVGAAPSFPPSAEGEVMRSVVGMWLAIGGRAVGCLLFGSAEPARYTEADAALLAALGPIVAMRVEGCVAAGHLKIVRSHLATLRAVPAHLGRLAGVLAATADPAEATRRVAVEAAAVLGFERLHFALILNEEDRVAIMAPGESRALLDLPLTPVAGTGLGRVVRGEVPNLTVRAERRADLIVALRVGGRGIGAMILTGGDSTMFGQADVEIAQQLADLVAPHLELVRRQAVAPPPMVPGWKRAPKF